jgi:hypothetical protein
MMTRTEILARIESLRADQEVASNTFKALHGAIQDCEYWLAQLPTEEQASPGPIAAPAAALLD